MPYIQISTSKSLTAEEKQALRQNALEAAAMLGKKKSVVMVQIQDGLTITRGEGNGPCAFCDVRVMGETTRDACDRFAERLSADVARIAQAAPQCVYLSISQLLLCYTDGRLPPEH